MAGATVAAVAWQEQLRRWQLEGMVYVKALRAVDDLAQIMRTLLC
jgi:hypothetical protein